MRVREAMTRDVAIINAEENLQQAARMMAVMDTGILPVGDEGRLVGMLSDRDIAVRAVAGGKGPDTKVRDVMSSEVMYCFDDQEIEDVTDNMGDIQVRRLPVLNRDKELVGIISLGDIALTDGSGAATALRGIARPSAQHNPGGA
ncbi:CBS domain-containing protein [Bradyrhizobium sp. LHD-71]|uniref:CBS domain-containing protein n=1 Tax=Bradyrhizobium sp. LHD-71 TaxID=3072141 RepID=UPI00280E6CF8|nr:CBS domain-containing protein [Bradyrhizobium sp. LHD-71]MDQ8729356.1 CBS domain-containing protein [Bradyrhizobium sp. LHD-71]